MFINKERLKVKSEALDNITKISIDYYKIKDKSTIKLNILSDLIENNSCLAIIDTKLQYNEAKYDTQELIKTLELSEIPYKDIIIKGEENLKVLGISMKAPGGKKIIGHIIGLEVDKERLITLKELLDNYNMYFCINNKGINSEVLLEGIQEYYNDGEEALEIYDLIIFNSNSFNKMTIKSHSSKNEFVNKIIADYNK